MKEEFLDEEESNLNSQGHARSSVPKHIKDAIRDAKAITAEDPMAQLERPIPWDEHKHDFYWCDHSQKRENGCPLPVPCRRERISSSSNSKCVRVPWEETESWAPSARSRTLAEVVHEALLSLSKGIAHFDHLRAAVRSYFPAFRLGTLLPVGAEMGERALLDLMQKIANLALLSEEIITQRLPRLGDIEHPTSIFRSVTMSQEQAACVLAYGFLCCPFKSNEGYSRFNFKDIFNPRNDRAQEKLYFLLAYFDRVLLKMPTGVISFKRQMFASKDEACSLSDCSSPLIPPLVVKKGRLEDAAGCAHVDFANKCIGGGVLSHGQVQEEIMFLCCPETLVSLLICDPLNNKEAVIIHGAEKYSDYRGYGSSLQWVRYAGNELERDVFGRARSSIIAIDAVQFEEGSNAQYWDSRIKREIMKAYAGFRRMGHDAPGRPIATGNWGCGVFNGDKELKSLIQLVASSRARRPLVYFPYDDEFFSRSFPQICHLLLKHQFTSGKLYTLLLEYGKARLEDERRRKRTLFDFIRARLAKQPSETVRNI